MCFIELTIPNSANVFAHYLLILTIYTSLTKSTLISLEIRTRYGEHLAHLTYGGSETSSVSHNIFNSENFSNKSWLKPVKHKMDRKLLNSDESLGIIKDDNLGNNWRNQTSFICLYNLSK